MILYPAIDIQRGRCVRLYQGDFNNETVYSMDPLGMVKTMTAAGAKWLHLIDLDGAKDPKQHQNNVIFELLKASNISIQVGGGIRTIEQVKQLIESGADRVIIGSLAVTDFEMVSHWFSYFGSDKLVLALDIQMDKNNCPKVTSNGWQQTSEYSLYDLIQFYRPVGLKHVLCTNVHLDGTLNGPDDALYEQLLNQFPFLNIQASGGIQSLSDVKRLRQKGLAGAVIGRALYENRFTLEEALAC